MRSLLLIMILSISGCAHRAAMPANGTSPQPPKEITCRPIPRSCYLPIVPPAPSIVGFPAPATIYVTMTDVNNIVWWMTAMTDWIRAAEKCLQSPY